MRRDKMMDAISILRGIKSRDFFFNRSLRSTIGQGVEKKDKGKPKDNCTNSTSSFSMAFPKGKDNGWPVQYTCTSWALHMKWNGIGGARE